MSKESFSADNVYTAASYGCMHAVMTLLDKGIEVDKDKLMDSAIASGSRWLCSALIFRGFRVPAKMCNERVEDGYVGLYDVFYNLNSHPPKKSDVHDELLNSLIERYISDNKDDKPARLRTILKVIEGYDVTASISHAANLDNFETFDILRKHGSYDMSRRQEDESGEETSLWYRWKRHQAY